MIMFVYIPIFILLIASCSSDITLVSSPPDAVVSVVEPGKETLKPIGKTPISISTDEIAESVDSGTIILVLNKRGYSPQRFIVPNLSGGDLRIESYLDTNLDTDYKEVNRVISLVLATERLVLEKRYDEGLKSVEKIKNINGNISAAHQLEGSIYFLKKEFNKSRFAWLRAIQLEPDNADAVNMLSIIEKRLGIENSDK